MLLATFKLCAGSSYRHVRNMKGEFPGQGAARAETRALRQCGHAGLGGQATQALTPIGLLWGEPARVSSLLDLSFPV